MVFEEVHLCPDGQIHLPVSVSLRPGDNVHYGAAAKAERVPFACSGKPEQAQRHSRFRAASSLLRRESAPGCIKGLAQHGDRFRVVNASLRDLHRPYSILHLQGGQYNPLALRSLSIGSPTQRPIFCSLVAIVPTRKNDVLFEAGDVAMRDDALTVRRRRSPRRRRWQRHGRKPKKT
jgi:hypothetical protein